MKPIERPLPRRAQIADSQLREVDVERMDYRLPLLDTIDPRDSLYRLPNEGNE